MTAQPPPPVPASPPGGPGVAAFFDRIRRYGAVRPDEGRWFAGVSAGLARRWGVDPLLVRGAFVILTVFGGVGLLLYGLGWLFLPHPDGRIHAQEVLRGVVTPGFIGGLLFVLLNIGGSGWSHDGWFGPHPFGGLVFVALVALGVWWFASGRHRRAPGAPGGPHGPGGWGGGPGGPHRGGPGGSGGYGGSSWGAGWGGPGTTSEPGTPTGSSGTTGSWAGTTPPTQGGRPSADLSPPGASAPDGGEPEGKAPDTSGEDDIPPYGTPPPRGFSPGGYPAADYLAEPGRPPSGPGAATVVLAPPVPPRWAPRRDVQRPSHALTNATLGAALLGAAVVVIWSMVWGFQEPAGFVAAAVALGIVALGIVAAGTSGRRAGGLAPIGILLAVATLAGGSAAGRMTWAGERTWTPTVVQGKTSYVFGMGNGRLDLRQVTAPNASAGSPAEIDARVGVGSLTVVVPNGVGVRIVGTTGAGNIDNAAQLTPTPGTPAAAPSPRRGPSADVDVQTAADPVIVVRASVGVGKLTIDGPNG
jgi:phage shock protein PspC (stress-responsive transcriptional regulator)